MKTLTEERWITRREAAELAGVHLNTVRLWESTGRVRTRKAEDGRVVLVPEAEVKSIVEAKQDHEVGDKARIAALEAELRAVSAERDRLLTEHATLLERILEIAGGHGREEGGTRG